MKPSLHRSVVFLSIVWLVAADAAAQSNYEQWTTDDGLPQGSINDIVQTRDGYLWLATFGGLVRFDGSRFVVFDTDVEGIRSQRFRVLREDSEGTLWAATEDGLLIRHRGGRFTAYGGEDGLPHTEALRIDEDVERNLWITWNTGIVTKFDRTRFVNYGPADLDRRVAPHARYSAEPHRRYYSKFDVWWSRDGDGLHTLVKGHVRTLSAGRDLPDTSAIAILTDAPGNLLLRMTDGAVHQVTGGRTLPLNTLRLPGDVLPEAFVSVSDDELWFSAGLRDLYHFANGRLEKRSTFPTSILSLCVDREGSMWVGTSGGLHRMRDVAVVTHSEREGLSSNLVYSLLRTRGGTVWIGTWGAGLNQMDRERLRTYRRADGLPTDYITAIHEDRSGRLLVGTTRGVVYLDGNRFRKYDDGGQLAGGVSTGAYTIRVSANNLSTTGSYTVRRTYP